MAEASASLSPPAPSLSIVAEGLTDTSTSLRMPHPTQIVEQVVVWYCNSTSMFDTLSPTDDLPCFSLAVPCAIGAIFVFICLLCFTHFLLFLHPRHAHTHMSVCMKSLVFSLHAIIVAISVGIMFFEGKHLGADLAFGESMWVVMVGVEWSLSLLMLLLIWLTSRPEWELLLIEMWWLTNALSLAPMIVLLVHSLSFGQRPERRADVLLLACALLQLSVPGARLVHRLLGWNKPKSGQRRYLPLPGDMAKRRSPLQGASLWSMAMFNWCKPLLQHGSTHALNAEDLWELDSDDCARRNADRFVRAWKRSQPSVMRAMLRAYLGPFLWCGSMTITCALLNFIGPWSVGKLIQLAQDSSIPWYVCMAYVGALTLAKLLQGLIIEQYTFLCARLSMRLSSAFKHAIFSKMLVLSAGERQTRTAGDMINNITVDVQRIVNSFLGVWNILTLPLQISLSMYLLWRQVGWSFLAGLAAIVLVLLCNFYVARATQKVMQDGMTQRDIRIKATNEMLNAIRVIKLSAEEIKFQNKILSIRKVELDLIWRGLSLTAINIFLLWLAPTLVSVAVFGWYSGVAGQTLDATTVFTAVTLFRLLQEPLRTLPGFISQIVQAKIGYLQVSLTRVSALLVARERPNPYGSLVRGRLDAYTECGDGDAGVSGGKVDAWGDANHDGYDDHGAIGDGLLTAQRQADKRALGRQNGAAFGDWGETLSNFFWGGTNGGSRGSGSEEADPGRRSGEKGKRGEGIDDSEILIDGGDMHWKDSEDSEATLKDINLHVRHGELLLVVGRVGSGKSSLLASIAGEMNCSKAGWGLGSELAAEGVVRVHGAVCASWQQAWAQNMSCRDNILFGDELDAHRYEKVVHACQLDQDFVALPDGDETELGDNGVNLSGGQRIRLALARAAYARAPIVLMDDPLSALDSLVGHRVFEDLVLGVLKGRTRVIAMNQLRYVLCEEVDKIAVMQEGRMTLVPGVRSGVTQERVRILLQQLGIEVPEVPARAAARPSQTLRPTFSVLSEATAGEAPRKLIKDEEREVGRVSAQVYMRYINSVGGLGLASGLLAIQTCWQGLQVASDWWLSRWSDMSQEVQDTQIAFDICMYAGLALGSSAFVLVRTLLVSISGLRGGRRLFRAMLQSVARAPMRFFETTPSGRILNRMTEDQNQVDTSICFAFGSLLAQSFSVLGQVVVAAYVTKVMLIPLLPLAYVYWRVTIFYLASSRELQRLKSVSESPVINMFTTSSAGAATIRAFGPETMKKFVRTYQRTLNENQECVFAWAAAQQWFSLRLRIIGAAIIFIITSLLTLLRGHISPGLVGLAVSYGLTMEETCASWVMYWQGLENCMVGPERIFQYQMIEPEADIETQGGVQALPRDWPSEGTVEFQNVVMRYGDFGEAVLKGVSFTVPGGTKLGIVGRTGAGKSSVAAALFRLVEISSGCVRVGGISAESIGLHDLRRAMAIVPQNPQLFAGPLRSFLDPFDEHGDDIVWACLQQVGIEWFVGRDKDGLRMMLSDNGENLSVGQRQLVCLARVLLRKAKIVVMDEATASMDSETDALVHATVRTQFVGSTVIIVAHRIDTVMMCDNVMVMDGGQVIEFGPPSDLLKDRGSRFYRLATELTAAV